MVSYQSNDGVPCSADKWLLRETLCDDWGFEGFTITDWNNVGALVDSQKVCKDLREATKIAIEAGNHMIMTTPDFMDEAISLVNDNELDERLIDDAARRILTMKFALGLFDHKRYPAETSDFQGHTQKALEAARESLVLLKNTNNSLPLSNDDKKIAVIGPNADDIVAQLGDWSFGSQQARMVKNYHPRENITTLLDGMKQLSGLEITYSKGCHSYLPSEQDIDSAVAVAQGADVVICAVGDHLDNSGEGSDRADMALAGVQNELLEALRPICKKLIVVFIDSKPHATPWVAEHADTVIQAFNPGMLGVQAIAELIAGEFNPSGKLTISIPRHTGQMPVNYQEYPGWHLCRRTGGYWDVEAGPLWAFGEGLSYTNYKYSDLVLKTDKLSINDTLEVTVCVKNSGNRDGMEIVQLYINDTISSVVTPMKELKAFERVFLPAGESKIVTLKVDIVNLTLVLSDLTECVESGTFEVMVGPSSRDCDLIKTTFEVI